MKIYLPFLAFIVIPMLLLNAAAFQLLQNIRKNDYSRNLSQTEMAGNYLHNVLKESISASRGLIFEDDLQKLARVGAQKALSDYVALRSTDALFQRYFARGDESSLLVYYPSSSILLASGGSCGRLSEFYGGVYQFGGYSMEDLGALAAESTHEIRYHASEPFMIDGAAYSGFYYTTSLNPSGLAQDKSLIIGLLHQSFLDDALASLNESDGYTFLTDRYGTRLAHAGEPLCETVPYLPTEVMGYVPKQVYGDLFMVSYVCLPEGINLFHVKPASAIVRNTHMLTMLVLVLNVACIALCIGAALPIARRRSAKLRKTFSMLDMPSDSANDFYDSINHGIAALVDENRSLSVSLSRDIFLLRDEFWNKLLNNAFTDERTLLEMAGYADMNLVSPYYCLIILAVKQQSPSLDFSQGDALESEAVRGYRENLLDFAELGTAARGYAHNASVQQTLILLRICEEERAGYQDIVEALLHALPDRPAGISLGCVGSRLFDSVGAAYEEYTYCSSILLRYYETLSSAQVRLVWSEEEYGRRESFYFPQRLHDNMVAAIRAGESDAVAGGFRELFAHNFSSDSSVTPTMSGMLLTKLKLVVMEAYQEEMDFDLHDSFRRIDALPTDAVKISYFISLSSKMCEFYRNHIRQKTEKLRGKIAGYIDAQFTGPSFSLSEVAAHCGFSDSYFSVLFREVMQVNFSAYVEKKKMEFADRLLRESKLKVEEIALKTGYSDPNAFRRAYKKYFSVSPSARRQSS